MGNGVSFSFSFYWRALYILWLAMGDSDGFNDCKRLGDWDMRDTHGSQMPWRWQEYCSLEFLYEVVIVTNLVWYIYIRSFLFVRRNYIDRYHPISFPCCSIVYEAPFLLVYDSPLQFQMESVHISRFMKPQLSCNNTIYWNLDTSSTTCPTALPIPVSLTNTT